jgi:ribosomal protein S27AE
MIGEHIFITEPPECVNGLYVNSGIHYMQGHIVEELAKYEDTGLTPKQIDGLRAGALRSDKTMHKAYNTALARRYYGATCPRCGGLLGVAYHEDRLYSVKCEKCETLTLVEARNPCDAQHKAGGVRQGGLDTTETRP